MSEDNQALVRRYLSRVDTGDVGVIDEFIVPDYNDHNPPPFQRPGHGADGARDAFAYGFEAMEGIAIHRIAEGKVVGHRATVDALSLLMQMGAVPPPT